jgi:glycosyltransferase involved in cell wall biosynthesis
MDRKTISIIVLTYNRKGLLEDCLHSLLAQTYSREKLEIIVSDDGSTDGTRELVERMQPHHGHLKYAYQPHRGIAAARNNGIVHATGDIVAIVADDYILNPSYASTIMRFFDQHPAAMVVRFKVIAAGTDLGSRISHFYFDVSVRRRLAPDPPAPARDWRERLAWVWRRPPRFEEKTTIHHQLEAAGAAAFRREVFARAGSFDESLQRAEDTDMTMRLRGMGIDIYYYPFQEIRHQYSPLMLDTVAKCFVTGVNRYRLYQKHAHLPGQRGAVRTLLSHEVQAALNALWRARQAESLPKLLCYLPFMIVFEAAAGLGFFAGFVSGLSRLAFRSGEL